MKSIWELLLLLQEGCYETNLVLHKKNVGLCGVAMYLSQLRRITTEEHAKLMGYMMDNKPHGADYVAWFPMEDKESRLEWIEEQLSR